MDDDSAKAAQQIIKGILEPGILGETPGACYLIAAEIVRALQDSGYSIVRKSPSAPGTKRCPRCLGHGVVPVMAGAHLSTRQPDDGDCSLCKGTGRVADTPSLPRPDGGRP